MLGADDIQGKQHGFLSGNHVYYVAGVYLVQNLHENETIGLPHPFFNDLRSRGTSIAFHPDVGLGNDFRGWEFYRSVKVASATVLKNGIRWPRPSPSHMYWSPDKIVVEYILESPYLQGIHEGWCPNWQQGSSSGSAFYNSATRSECFAYCDADASCEQAVHENSTQYGLQCWLGRNFIDVDETLRPPRNFCVQPYCQTFCYAKGRNVDGIRIREEKFIAANDVVSTTITSNVPVRLEFAGNSFDGAMLESDIRDSFVPNGTCRADSISNVVHVVEGGELLAKVTETGTHAAGHGGEYVMGRLMYDNMSTVIGASRSMVNVSISEIRAGVCAYTFELPLDAQGVTLSWTMHDVFETALASVLAVVGDASTYKQAKTASMNELLNYGVPYFRCSDFDLVKVYYYLWSINLMYYTHGDSGMEVYPHTQSAVHNFLGMHRFDGVMQVAAGAWISPDRHAYYANGNVLVWNMTMPFRQRDFLPDNLGQGWVSGLYGGEVIGHVIGACHIWEHSGNTTFLELAYDFYKTLYWDEIRTSFWGYAYDGVLCLNKMATALGYPEHVAHWNATVRMNWAREIWLPAEWEKETPGLFGGTSVRIDWGNLAAMGTQIFPREWALQTTSRWIDNSVDGFSYGDVPLLCVARSNWSEPVDPSIGADYNFAVTPDANFFMLRGLYHQNIVGTANRFALQHLKRYNMEWGIPVAPEARRMDFSMHGDQYSNFNAGKILTFIEGIGGLKYSAVDDTFTFADNLPTNWTFMEWRVPVPNPAGVDGSVTWVKARAERRQEGTWVVKTVHVAANPFSSLIVQPWAEDTVVTMASPGSVVNPPPSRVAWDVNTSAALKGIYPGWCGNWQNGSAVGSSYFTDVSSSECFALCDADASCEQAVYEESMRHGRQCFLGLNSMSVDQVPTGQNDFCSSSFCETLCYAKGRGVSDASFVLTLG